MSKVYSYKGKLYSDDYFLYWPSNRDKYDGDLDELVELLTDNDTGLESSQTTIYYLGGEFIGTEDKGSDEILEIFCENGYGDDIDLKEVEVDESEN